MDFSEVRLHLVGLYFIRTSFRLELSSAVSSQGRKEVRLDFYLFTKKKEDSEFNSGSSEVTYTIRFKPDARIDYSYNLIVLTEREKSASTSALYLCGGSCGCQTCRQ